MRVLKEIMKCLLILIVMLQLESVNSKSPKIAYKIKIAVDKYYKIFYFFLVLFLTGNIITIYHTLQMCRTDWKIGSTELTKS